MKELARSYLWWPNIDSEIEQTVRNCSSSQQVRKPLAAAPLAPWMWPSNPWHRIHIDFAEDEKEALFHSRGRTLLVARDFLHATKYIGSVNDHCLKGTIRHYGIPAHYVTDNGPQFCSEELTRFLKMNGVKHHHAASNGLAERMVQSFKNHMKVCKGSKPSIQQRTENFLLTYRSSKQPTTSRSPASLRTRLSLLRPNVDSQAKQKATHDVHARMLREF